MRLTTELRGDRVVLCGVQRAIVKVDGEENASTISPYCNDWREHGRPLADRRGAYVSDALGGCVCRSMARLIARKTDVRRSVQTLRRAVEALERRGRGRSFKASHRVAGGAECGHTPIDRRPVRRRHAHQSCST